MSAPLPDGWSDTGETYTWVFEADATLGADLTDPSGLTSDVIAGAKAGFSYRPDNVGGVPFNHRASEWLIQRLKTGSTLCDGYQETDFGGESGSYRIEVGPLRVGIRYRDLEMFAQSLFNPCEIQLELFCDADTLVQESGPGGSTTWYLRRWYESGSYSPSAHGGISFGDWFEFEGGDRCVPMDPDTVPAMVPGGGYVGMNLSGVGSTISSAKMNGELIPAQYYIDRINPAIGPIGSDILSQGFEGGFTTYSVVTPFGLPSPPFPPTFTYYGAINEATIGPPIQFRYDIDVRRHGVDSWEEVILSDRTLTQLMIQPVDGALTPAGTIQQPYFPDGIPNPFQAEYNFPQINWANQCPIKCFPTNQRISGPSDPTDPPVVELFTTYLVRNYDTLAPPVYGRDRRIPIYVSRKFRGTGIYGYGYGGYELEPYYPISVTLTPEISVHRPEGHKPSEWATDDVSHGTVSESSTETTFEVLDTAAAFTRTFATKWRNRVGLGVGGSSHPDYIRHSYVTTKHNFYGADGEDVYGWETYGFARIEIDAPADGSCVLHADGVYLDANEYATPDIDDTFSASWRIDLVAGFNSVEIDLLFPSEGGPFTPGRVDKLRLSGFSVTGEYVLSELALFVKHGGYIKVDTPTPIIGTVLDSELDTVDHGSIVVNVDGSEPLYNWANNYQRNFEKSDYGGAINWFDFNDPDHGGIQFNMATFWDLLNRKEGWVVTYDGAAADAGYRDDAGQPPWQAIFDGVYPGYFERADWMLPILPHQALTAGVAYKPPAAMSCGVLFVTSPVGPVLVHARRNYWSAVEGVAGTPAGRLAGVTVDAVDEATGVTVGTAVTDVAGFVMVAPVPGQDENPPEFRLEAQP